MINKPTLNNALERVIQATSKEACDLLIDAGADIIDGSLYHYPLTMAVCNGEKDLAAFLLDRGADVNCQSETGKPLLTLAVCNATKDLAAFLLDRGADVNYESKNGETPLTIAVRHGKIDFAHLLLDRGADVNYQSGDETANSSPLRAAITNGDEVMISFLYQRGADLNAVQRCNEIKYSGYPTGIHEASARNRLAIVDLLINLGVDFNSPQKNYGTPLMLSIYSGRFSTAELLIKRGANINEVNMPLKHPETLFYSAIHIAIYVSSPYLVALLLRNSVGTVLREAYEFAAQHTVMLSRSVSYPYPTKLYCETRNREELSNDARQVQELLKEQKERSGVQD